MVQLWLCQRSLLNHQRLDMLQGWFLPIHTHRHNCTGFSWNLPHLLIFCSRCLDNWIVWTWSWLVFSINSLILTQLLRTADLSWRYSGTYYSGFMDIRVQWFPPRGTLDTYKIPTDICLTYLNWGVELKCEKKHMQRKWFALSACKKWTSEVGVYKSQDFFVFRFFNRWNKYLYKYIRWVPGGFAEFCKYLFKFGNILKHKVTHIPYV